MSTYARLAVSLVFWGLVQSSERGFVYCPAYPCSCESVDGELMVNCRNLYLSHLPKFLSFQGRIKELSLRHNSIQSLPARGFQNLHVEQLDLLDNALTVISDDAFAGLENSLLSLSLQLYAMYGLPTIPLSQLSRLNRLIIRGCWQPVLDVAMFMNLTELKELHLTGCRIANIRPDAFSRLHHLSTLVLSQNALQSRHLAELHLLDNLVYLDLSYNGIKHLSNTALAGFSKLQNLKIGSNKLVTVSKLAFRNLAFSLEDLDIRDNHVNDDVLRTLADLKLLRRLDLSQNHISNLSEQYFSGMRLLTSLNVASNNIRVIDQRSFHGLGSSIRELNIYDNPLELIQPGTFSDLRVLEKLNLSNTKLGGTFRGRTLDGLTASLKSLDVSKSFLVSDDIQAFSSLTNITSLDLSSNRITDIDFQLVRLWRSLRHANFSHNNVSTLLTTTLSASVSTLQILDLSWNDIKTIPECIFFVFKDLSDVRLEGNPLVCNCSLSWLYRWLQFQLSRQHQLYRKWTCRSPFSIKDSHFSDLQLSDFKCPNSPAMGERCMDLHDTLWTDRKNFQIPAVNLCGPICLNISRLQVDSAYVEWLPKDSLGCTKFYIMLKRRNDSSEVWSALIAGSIRNYTLTISSTTELEVCVIALDKEILPLAQSCHEVPAFNVGQDDASSQARLVDLMHNAFIPLIFIYICSSLAIAFIVACIVVCVQRKQKVPRRVKPFYLSYPAWHDNRSSVCSSSFIHDPYFLGTSITRSQLTDMLRLNTGNIETTTSGDLLSMMSSRRQSKVCGNGLNCQFSTISSLPRFETENLARPDETENKFFFHF